MNANPPLGTDAVSVEIFANLFRAVVDEMTWIVRRSAHTTFIKETQDFGTALVTPGGEHFAVPDSTGVISLIGTPISPLIDAFDDWQPGDVGITNDPYTTQGMVMHLNDMFMVRPIHVDGELICFAWSFLHCSDVGGNVPGSIDSANQEVFQEGFRLPPSKLYRGGEVDETLVRVIAGNCRGPALNWGDLCAVTAALEAAEQRVKRLVARYGRDAFVSAMHAVLDRTETLTRKALQAIPVGSYKFTEFLEEDFVSDTPVRFQLCLTARGDGTVELDFSGSDPQARSAINLPTGGQRHHPMLSVALMNFAITRSAGLNVNAGIVRCIDLVLPEHSVVNCSFPAACGARVVAVMKIHDMTLGALSKILPGQVPAAGGSQLAVTSISTPQPDGSTRVVSANAIVGGSGGGMELDGVDGIDFPAAALRNVPTEILESEAPVIVHRFALRENSEGAGAHRGGFGIEYAFEITQPGVAIVTRGKDRHRFAPWGTGGGRAGVPGFSVVERPRMPAFAIGKQALYRPRPGEVVIVAGSGGGGNGNPFRRDPELVRDDVRNELVSRERARLAYGVEFAGDLELDVEATRRLRAAAEPYEGAFDFGRGRTEWEAQCGAAYAAIAEWAAGLPPRARRAAHERAYLLVKERIGSDLTRDAVSVLLAELGAELDPTSAPVFNRSTHHPRETASSRI